MKAIWITLFCCLSILLSGQDESCYAKLLVPEFLETVKVPFETDGNEKANYASNEGVMVETDPTSHKWVKRKADGDCRSENPDDCLVWCLVEIPANMERRNFMYEFLPEKSLLPIEFIKQKVSTGLYRYEWRPIICWNNILWKERKTIVKELKKEGYLKERRNQFFTQKVMDALHQFQEDKELPIGFLNYETLDFFWNRLLKILWKKSPIK